MHEYSFTVDSADEDGTVTGRNADRDIPVGTVFNQLCKTTVDTPSNLPESVTSICLKLAEVVFYGRSIELIPGGHTAMLRLDGEGLVTLINLLKASKETECVTITSTQP